MLSFFPRDVLDEIWDLIESVSEGFPSYSRSTENIVKYLGCPKGIAVLDWWESSQMFER